MVLRGSSEVANYELLIRYRVLCDLKVQDAVSRNAVNAHGGLKGFAAIQSALYKLSTSEEKGV